MFMAKTLTKKEQDFCDYYFATRNPREAAIYAGYSLNPARAGAKLLLKSAISDEIQKRDSKNAARIEEICAGLRRLAFGSVADAVKLAYSEEPLSGGQIEELDLFNISEIKRPKGGGTEIKFFDRLKALEKLQTLCEASGESRALPFYEAMEKGARLLYADKNKKPDVTEDI